MTKSAVQVRRIYDLPRPRDGQRLLVDRLRRRGLSEEKAQVDEWVKAVAPSDELRRWYGHAPEKFEEFKRRYGQELTATRDIEHSQAAVLADRLESR